MVARAGGEEAVEQGEELCPPFGRVHGFPQVAEARLLDLCVEAEADHGLLPLVAGELEHHGLAVAVVEACRHGRPLARAGDTGLACHRIGAAPQGGRERPAEQANDAAKERQLDLLADAGGARMRQSRERAAEGENGARLVSDGGDAGAHRLARRGVGLRDAAERLRHGVLFPANARWVPLGP